MALKVGDQAPDFSLPAATGETRGDFIVSKSGEIAWSKVYELKERPDNAEILEALRKLA